jgi:hypothetical protein
MGGIYQVAYQIQMPLVARSIPMEAQHRRTQGLDIGGAVKQTSIVSKWTIGRGWGAHSARTSKGAGSVDKLSARAAGDALFKALQLGPEQAPES